MYINYHPYLCNAVSPKSSEREWDLSIVFHCFVNWQLYVAWCQYQYRDFWERLFLFPKAKCALAHVLTPRFCSAQSIQYSRILPFWMWGCVLFYIYQYIYMMCIDTPLLNWKYRLFYFWNDSKKKCQNDQQTMTTRGLAMTLRNSKAPNPIAKTRRAGAKC